MWYIENIDCTSNQQGAVAPLYILPAGGNITIVNRSPVLGSGVQLTFGLLLRQLYAWEYRLNNNVVVIPVAFDEFLEITKELKSAIAPLVAQHNFLNISKKEVCELCLIYSVLLKKLPEWAWMEKRNKQLQHSKWFSIIFSGSLNSKSGGYSCDILRFLEEITEVKVAIGHTKNI